MNDLLNNTYGRWLVIAREPNDLKNRGCRWLCKCVCGVEKIVGSHNLVAGISKSCGCLHREIMKNVNKGKAPPNKDKYEDLLGKIFGKLIVLELHGKNKYNQRRWKTKCLCGNFKIACGSDLRKGNVKSCGCLVLETNRIEAKKRALPGTAFRRLIYQYKRSCFKRGINFELSDQSFEQLVIGECHYCGVSKDRTIRAMSGEEYTYTGIDRLDSDLGYTSENSISCCLMCNMMKRIMSYDNFINKCVEIYTNHGRI